MTCGYVHTCRALTFSCALDTEGAAPAILSLPSKRTVLRCLGNGSGLPVLIARSDANGEDLQDLAGAGLYDRYARFWDYTYACTRC